MFEPIQTKEEFATLVEKIKSKESYRAPIGFAIGRVDLGQVNADKVLQVSYPVINWNENFGSAAIFKEIIDRLTPTPPVENNLNIINSTENELVVRIDTEIINAAMAMFNPFLEEAIDDQHKNVQVVKYLNQLEEHINLGTAIYDIVFIYNDVKTETVQSAYLKLYALSARKAELRSLNLEGIFGLMTNCAWVENQPIELDWLRKNEIHLKMMRRYPNIEYVDKFPLFLHHIIPDDNMRILDAKKARMGCQLAPGTTVMPGASYVNFNSGTTGPVMVEGRISSSAIVGSGSDIGGGASILGVLSGTDGNPITIGEKCLLGANSVCGIPLGDGCIIDAGITVLAKTPVFVTDTELTKIQEANPDSDIGKLQVTKDGFYAHLFSGLNGLHFRQDSISGRMILFRSNREIKLNKELH